MLTFKKYLREAEDDSQEEDEKKKLQANQSKPLDQYTDGQVSDIERDVKAGAKDLEQKWRDGIHLLNKAFEVNQITVPTPADRKRWKQYEELLGKAVDALVKFRGIDGEWRKTHPIKEGVDKTIIVSKGETIYIKESVDRELTEEQCIKQYAAKIFKPRFDRVGVIKQGRQYRVMLEGVRTDYIIQIEAHDEDESQELL